MAELSPDLVAALRFSNPWLFRGGRTLEQEAERRLPSSLVPRRQLDVDALTAPDRAHLVTGPRQAGKSTLVWTLLARRHRPLFVNLEEHVFRRWCASPIAFLDGLWSLGAPPDLLFLEEAQRLPEVGLFVKGIVDHRPGFPVVVTGSASFQLLSRTRESLAGRASRHLLLPFGLAEVAPPEGASPVELELERRAALARMLEVGGYPEAWLSDEPRRVLVELLQSFVFRDASDLFGVERLDAFDALLRLAAGQVGSLVNVLEWSSLCGVSQDTVSRYLAMMEEAHLLVRVPAFAGGKRREVTSARKVYFVDGGLRGALLSLSGPPSPVELGARVENLVFTELRKALPWDQVIRYWRSASKAEVDFVVPRGDRLLGIEVKAGRLARAKLARSSRSFIQAYEPGEFWVLSDGLRHEEALGATRVRWLRVMDLPELVGEWLAG